MRTTTMILFFAAVILHSDGSMAYQAKAPHFRQIDQQLFDAVENGSTGLIAGLISRGANVNARNENGETPLHRATSRRVADLLITKGADLNAADNEFKMTPLFNANLEVTELLIAKGADVNAKSKGGETPLGWTVYWDMLDKAKLLIAKGADINGVPGTKNPLHIAANWGKREFAELLLAKGADINARDADGWTALHWAAFEGGVDMASWLVSRGADRNARAGMAPGMFPVSATPLDVAERIKMFDVAAFLRSRGGKRSSEIRPPVSPPGK